MIKDKKIKQLRIVQTIGFTLLLIGLGSIVLGGGLSYYYKAELSGGACGLCIELIPEYQVCEWVTSGESVVDFKIVNG